VQPLRSECYLQAGDTLRQDRDQQEATTASHHSQIRPQTGRGNDARTESEWTTMEVE